MDVYNLLPDTLASRLQDLEVRLSRVERSRSLASRIQVPWFLSAQTTIGTTSFPMYWTFTNTLLGPSLSYDLVVTVQDIHEYCDYQIRYYQESPRIYTDAQIAAETYVLLGSGSFAGGITDQHSTVTVDVSSLQGTYGRVDFCLQASSSTGGHQSYVAVESIAFV